MPSRSQHKPISPIGFCAVQRRIGASKITVSPIPAPISATPALTVKLIARQLATVTINSATRSRSRPSCTYIAITHLPFCTCCSYPLPCAPSPSVQAVSGLDLSQLRPHRRVRSGGVLFERIHERDTESLSRPWSVERLIPPIPGGLEEVLTFVGCMKVAD